MVGCFLPLLLGFLSLHSSLKNYRVNIAPPALSLLFSAQCSFPRLLSEKEKGGEKNLLRSSPASNRSCSSMQCPPKVYIILACIQIRPFFVYPPLISADYRFCVITPNNSVSIGWRIAFPSNVLIKNDHRSYSFLWHFAHAAVCKASCLSYTA